MVDQLSPLQEKVLRYLRAHPRQEFTPHQMGQELGHSGGAVLATISRLMGLGLVEETEHAPRRFRSVPKSRRPLSHAS